MKFIELSLVSADLSKLVSREIENEWFSLFTEVYIYNSSIYDMFHIEEKSFNYLIKNLFKHLFIRQTETYFSCELKVSEETRKS